MRIYKITKILALTLENQRRKKEPLKQILCEIIKKIINVALKDGGWPFSNSVGYIC
jgi:hypothetical protein